MRLGIKHPTEFREIFDATAVFSADNQFVNMLKTNEITDIF
jgi:hypothetical protein